MANIIITFNDGAESTRTSIVEGSTVASLLADNNFVEDFNISPRSIPLINGAEVQNTYVLQPGDVFSTQIGASSKSR